MKRDTLAEYQFVFQKIEELRRFPIHSMIPALTLIQKLVKDIARTELLINIL